MASRIPERRAAARLDRQRSTSTAGFAYDGDGIRRKRLDANGVVHYVSGGYEVDKGNGLSRTSDTVTKLYRFAGRLIAVRKGGTLSYVGTDHLGSPIQVTDTSFVAVSAGQQRYTPFGTSRDSGAGIPTDHLFTSQVRDASIGLYWYSSRAYDPALGRFCQPDSLVPSPGDPQSLNRYSYVRNNPLKYLDPSGHAIVRTDYAAGLAGDAQFARDILGDLGAKGVISSGPSGAFINDAAERIASGLGAGGLGISWLTPEQVQQTMPASRLSRDDAAEQAFFLTIAMRTAGITTAKGEAAFLAQVSRETGDLSSFSEKWDGDSEFAYFESMYGPNTVAGRNVGNTTPGDGPRFRGRGYLQLTGRYNYTRAQAELGLGNAGWDIVSQPETVADNPMVGALVSGWYFQFRGLTADANAGNIGAVSRGINPGMSSANFAERARLYERNVRLFGAP